MWGACGFRMREKCKETRVCEEGDGSKAKVGGKRTGFLGGSTKRLLTNLILCAWGNCRAQRAGRGSRCPRLARGGNNPPWASKTSDRWGFILSCRFKSSATQELVYRTWFTKPNEPSHRMGPARRFTRQNSFFLWTANINDNFRYKLMIILT